MEKCTSQKFQGMYDRSAAGRLSLHLGGHLRSVYQDKGIRKVLNGLSLWSIFGFSSGNKGENRLNLCLACLPK